MAQRSLQTTAARIPGWGLMLLIAYLSQLLSSRVEIGGKHPIEAAVVAILFGVFIRNIGRVPQRAEAGIQAFEKVLVVGIVLVGASLDFGLFISQGLEILAIILATMCVGLAGTMLFSRFCGLSLNLSVLLGVGTTICGGTAIAVTAPLMNAKEEDTSYAIGTVALFGLLALLIYPQLALLWDVSDQAFGVFAGTAIHSTPQVVGAGYIFSDTAGDTATAVKLVRNCFLAPAALIVAVWYRRSCAAGQRNGKGQGASLQKAFPWFLFGYFVVAFLNTQGFFTPEIQKFLVSSGKFLILTGMVGVGLNTRLSAFRSVGFTPLGVGFVASLLVAVVSTGLIGWFGLG